MNYAGNNINKFETWMLSWLQFVFNHKKLLIALSINSYHMGNFFGNIFVSCSFRNIHFPFCYDTQILVKLSKFQAWCRSWKTHPTSPIYCPPPLPRPCCSTPLRWTESLLGWIISSSGTVGWKEHPWSPSLTKSCRFHQLALSLPEWHLLHLMSADGS